MGMEKAKRIKMLFAWVCRLIPVYNLGWGHFVISLHQKDAAKKNLGVMTGLVVGGAHCPKEESGRRFDAMSDCTYLIGDELLALVFCSALYLGIVMNIELFRACFKRKSRSQCGTDGLYASDEDEMVSEEKKRVRK